MYSEQANSFQASQFSYMRTSFRMNAGQDLLAVNKLVELCSKYSITLIQLPDKRLEAGLNILPLKVKSKQTNQTLVIFVTKFNQKYFTITAYLNGKKVERANANTQQEIARLIKKWADFKNSSEQNYQKESLSIIQKLNMKCAQLAKQQKSQLIAIQKLKSTKQYTALVQHQIKLSMQLQSLSQLLFNLQAQISNKNDELSQNILQIEGLKNQIQQYQYGYEEICRCFRNVKDKIGQFMQKQRQRVEKMQITSQAELSIFLTEAKKFKKLQLQKRFIH